MLRTITYGAETELIEHKLCKAQKAHRAMKRQLCISNRDRIKCTETPKKTGGRECYIRTIKPAKWKWAGHALPEEKTITGQKDEWNGNQGQGKGK